MTFLVYSMGFSASTARIEGASSSAHLAVQDAGLFRFVRDWMVFFF